MTRVSRHVLGRPALLLGVLVSLAAGTAAQNETFGTVLPPVRLTSKEVKRLIIKAPRPRYPPLARLNYIQGHVRVEILISPQGRVEQAHVVKGHAFLAAAALRAVKRWRFRPYRMANQVHTVLSFVDVDFVLSRFKVGSLPPKPGDDLQRQVRPPRLLGKMPALGELVPMRVLVGKHGNVLDSMPDGRARSKSRQAREALQGLKFLPAHWGTLPVPWYVELQVPVAR